MIESNRPPVLVVEDNETNALLIQAALRRDFDVAIAANGEAARAWLRVRRPALVLMDIGLPDVDGITLTRELLAEPGFDVPIVILTAHALAADADAAKTAGAAAFITKPINTRTIVGELKEVLGNAFVTET